MPGYKDWIDAIDIKVDYFSAFMKAWIILYMLRCCLAHGDISPDESANEVYKYAYEVLCAPLKKLK